MFPANKKEEGGERSGEEEKRESKGEARAPTSSPGGDDNSRRPLELLAQVPRVSSENQRKGKDLLEDDTLCPERRRGPGALEEAV